MTLLRQNHATPCNTPTKQDLLNSLTPAAAEFNPPIHVATLRVLLVFLADSRGAFGKSTGRSSRWQQLRRTIAKQAGVVQKDAAERLAKIWPDCSSSLAMQVHESLVAIGSGALGDFEDVRTSCGGTSDLLLARIIDALSRHWPDDWSKPVWRDYRQCEVRLLGDLYEALLGESLAGASRQSPKGARLRKCTGMFYTPVSIVNYIVEQTIGTTLDERLEPFGRRLAAVRTKAELGAVLDDIQLSVLDPAAGTGHFLVAAARTISDRLCQRLDLAKHRLKTWLAGEVATRFIYGMDIDPLAVELARASLSLEFDLSPTNVANLRERLRCADALGCDVHEHAGFPAQFDAVIGNPPYGAQLDADQRNHARRQWPQMRHNGDTAVGFLELAHRWTAAGGRCGLIVPKPLTYSFAWREMRRLLAERVEQIVDVSRAWIEVRLEQVIVVLGKRRAIEGYTSRVLKQEKLSPAVQVPRQLIAGSGAWPCGLSAPQCRLAASLLVQGPRLGELCRTFRGLPWQNRLSRQGDLPVVGGRDLERWRVRGCSGWVDDAQADISAFQRKKLLFQNIVAHVTRPRPHLRLIGAHDANGLITLDTVNNLIWRPGNEGDLRGVLALLHSRLINWFIYQVIYSQAIRTMHFDQYFLDKVPVPVEWKRLLGDLSRLSADMEQSTSKLFHIIEEFTSAVYDQTGCSVSDRAARRLLAPDPLPLRSTHGLPGAIMDDYRHRAEIEIHHQQQLYGELNQAVDEAYGAADKAHWWSDR